jgi:DNA-binding NarL/FixJ family response regulator
VSSILIFDDHPLVREGLRSIIEAAFSGMPVVEAGDIDTALALLEAEADVEFVLLDYVMPGARGFSHLAALRDRFPVVPVIMVSAHADPALVAEAIRCGAAGFIPKSMGRSLIVDAINQVLAGGVFVPPSEWLQSLGPGPDPDPAILARLDHLTPQQRRVLDLVAEGRLNKQIAFALDITPSTVKAHVSAILEKLGVATRTQAALLLRRQADGGAPSRRSTGSGHGRSED